MAIHVIYVLMQQLPTTIPHSEVCASRLPDILSSASSLVVVIVKNNVYGAASMLLPLQKFDSSLDKRKTSIMRPATFGPSQSA